ncbi:aldehyde dehydrogenase [Frankia sp. CcI49]|uniref:aldehyde dehydrogenase n=1 Tax=Frankia sp. CcI49 TaxID=1745382 RepID=UPI000976D8B2|nr:aldehyde dehydrogenase [Frankia sp. CcI49]ONH60454.1 aldehyde dehydrogenase [Frankia sp. CcI49]
MAMTGEALWVLRHADHLYIAGKWVASSGASRIDVTDSTSEEVFVSVAEAQKADIARAVGAARTAFDDAPWPRLPHVRRADYLRDMADAIRRHADDYALVWPREAGVLQSHAKQFTFAAASIFDQYAAFAETFPFEERLSPQMGGFGLQVQEPVGVVGAIIPWNAPLLTAAWKLAAGLLAGCTVVLKSSPEAPGAGYLLAEIADEISLPDGVLNVVTADREVSELLVTDPRVDKIAFTGSTAAGRRIASLIGGRLGRYTLELGGKSAAVVLDDADIAAAAQVLAGAECMISGQVCSSLTRIIVDRRRHDELLEAVAAVFHQVTVGDPFDSATQMGPLVTERQRARVEGYIAMGKAQGATLAAGGGRPPGLDRGYFVEPTVFGNVENSSTIAQEEIFGPVLSVIPAENDEHAIRLANDSAYGLNGSVFTADLGRARAVAGEIRTGLLGHNTWRADFDVPFGGFKQSGVGREGGVEGLRPYLETKTIILEGPPEDYS